MGGVGLKKQGRVYGAAGLACCHSRVSELELTTLNTKHLLYLLEEGIIFY